jgi:uncharacterized protein (TIGR02099 family)
MSSPSEARLRTRRRLGHWSLGVLIAIAIAVAILASLFIAATFILPGYHDLIAKRVSSALGAPVTLGRVSLRWHGWGPELQFRKVAVHSPQTGKTLMSAKRLRLDFSVPALVHGAAARPYAIALDRPYVTLVRTANGGFRVPGIHFKGGAAAGGKMLGIAIELHDGTIELRFADSGRKPWTFSPVDLTVGGGKTHAIQLALGLPKPLGGDKLRVAGSLKTPKAKPKTWKWRGEATLDRLLVAPLDRYFPARWPRVTGALAFDIKARGHGKKLVHADGRLSATNIAANKGHLQRFATHLTFAAQNGYRLRLNDDVLQLSKLMWKPGKVVFARAPEGRIHAHIERIKLAAFPLLAGFLPSSRAKLAKRLHKMNPSGTIHGFDIALTPKHIQTLALAARLDDVGVYAAAGAPGFNHLAGSVKMRHGMGAFALDAPNFALRMPHLFPKTKGVKLERVAGKIGIALTPQGMHLALPHLTIRGTAGLNGAVEATMTIPHNGRVHARLAAWAAPLGVNGARPRYIPTGLLPKRLTRWLMHQLRNGRAGPMTMRLAGDMKRFPFQHGGGYFSVDFGVHNVALAPGKGWATITGINGMVHFKNATMHADIASGKVAGARVVGSRATIPNLFHPRLSVTTTVIGTLPDFIAFLKSSPIAGKVKGVFAKVKVQGKARTRLTLHLPVMHPNQFQLAGTMALSDAMLAYGKKPWKLNNVSGKLSYDGRGPTGGDLTASLFDAPVHISLAREKAARGQRLNVTVSGRFPVPTLSKLADYDFSRYASGYLPLEARLAVPLAAKPFPLTVNLSSNLKGLDIKLPVPAGKSAIAKRPFMARVRVDKDALGIEARYAHVASVCAALATGGAQPSLSAGELDLGGGGCKTPQTGFYVRGGWQELDVKPWLKVLPKKKLGAGNSGALKIKRLNVAVRFGTIRVLGQTLKNQSIRGTLDPKRLKLALGGPELAGTIYVPHKPTNTDPITAILTRAHLVLPSKPVLAQAPASGASAPKPAAPPVQTQPKAAGKQVADHFKPQEIPPFVFTSKQLMLGTAPLDDVKVVGRRVPNGLVVNPVHIGGGALRFNGQFVWLNPSGSGAQGALQFVANVSSLGKLLEGLGIGQAVTGHGALSAALAWREPKPGAKFAAGLLGKVSTDLRDGSISEVSPGAGRLLSLLSLVNIPRYLVFNFHNLFSKGFPFSRIYGDYHIRKGIARTKGLHIESSIADINLTGDVDLVNETMDQTAEVEPNYFGSLPVVGAIVGGLGVGAVIFALTKLFGNPLGKALAMHYSIKGPITKPVVKKAGGTPQRAPAPATAGAH